MMKLMRLLNQERGTSTKEVAIPEEEEVSSEEEEASSEEEEASLEEEKEDSTKIWIRKLKIIDSIDSSTISLIMTNTIHKETSQEEEEGEGAEEAITWRKKAFRISLMREEIAERVNT